MTLRSESFSLRTAAVSDFAEMMGADLAAHIARLDAEKQQRRVTHDREIEDARQIVAAKAIEIEQDIATRAFPKLAKLASAFADKPRSTAGAFGIEWRSFNAECLENLGAPLSHRFVGAAFGMALNVAERTGARFFWVFDGLNPAAQHVVDLTKLIVEGGTAVEVESAIRELEVHISKRTRNYVADPVRFGASISRATESAIRGAVAIVDDARDADHAAAMAAQAQAANPDPHLMGAPLDLTPEVPKFFFEQV